MHLRSLAAAGFLAACLAAGLVLPLQATAADRTGQLDLPSFTHLQSKATEVVDITLGTWPLALASKFMEEDDAESVEVKRSARPGGRNQLRRRVSSSGAVSR